MLKLLIKKFVTNPATVHDAILYTASYLTILGATGAGATWSAALAAIPPAISAGTRELQIVHLNNRVQATAAKMNQQQGPTS